MVNKAIRKKKVFFYLFLLLFSAIFLQSAEASITASIDGCSITFTAIYEGPSNENGYGNWGVIPCDIYECDSSYFGSGNRVNSMVINETVHTFASGTAGVAVQVRWDPYGGGFKHEEFSAILPFDYQSCAACNDNDSDGYTNCDGDCDDNDPTVYPGAPEICDGKYNDCNGQIDETCDGCSPNSTDMGSSANLASGNLYHSQQVLGSHGTGFTASITIAYNSLDTTIGPLGRGWTHNYNTNITENENALILAEEDGRRVYFYNNGDDTYSPDASSGSYSTITKNPDGSYTLTEKTGIEYNYDSNGKLTSITDRNSNTLSLTYTGDDLTLITDSSGKETTLVNDSDHRITSITDNAGRTTTFTYNSSGYLSTKTGPSGNTWKYTYDAAGRMLTKTDPLGYTTTYTYDANGKVISSQDPEGNTKTISYDQTNQTAYVTEKNSGQWTYIMTTALMSLLKSQALWGIRQDTSMIQTEI